jgi:pimeloyl-ACP methyl ester carboxylesterase
MARSPITRYTKSGEVNIAYQVIGDGPADLVYVPGFVSNIEVMWEDPDGERFLNALAEFSRLIVFDKRGTGMSDAVSLDRLPTLEERMDDVRAVMDTVGSTRATLLGHSEGGNMSTLFAATYPDRCDGLILVGCYARRIWTEWYPWAPRLEDRERHIAETERHWGDPSKLPEWMAPSRRDDEPYREWLARYFRLGASPAAAAHLLRMNSMIDTTSVLPVIRVPTLCVYRTDDEDVRLDEGRWIASRIPDARFVELPGRDHFITAGDYEPLLDEIREFVTGHRPARDSHRALATVLFTDIVGSTEAAATMGDQRWTALLQRHRVVIRNELNRFRGREVDTTGDGFLATFDGPARAIAAARSICAQVRSLGLPADRSMAAGSVPSTSRTTRRGWVLAGQGLGVAEAVPDVGVAGGVAEGLLLAATADQDRDVPGPGRG